MLSVVNVATPFTAATLFVPDSAPAPALIPIAMVTLPVKVETVFPPASWAATWIAGVMGSRGAALLGWTVKISLVGVAVILKGALVAVRPAAAAVSVYPDPALSTLKSGKMATPTMAVTLVAPPSVPPLGFVPIATVTLPAKLIARFPSASRAVTCTAGLIVAPASVVAGWPVNTSWLAGPAMPVAVKVTGLPERPVAVAVTVFVPAVVPSVHMTDA